MKLSSDEEAALKKSAEAVQELVDVFRKTRSKVVDIRGASAQIR